MPRKPSSIASRLQFSRFNPSIEPFDKTFSLGVNSAIDNHSFSGRRKLTNNNRQSARYHMKATTECVKRLHVVNVMIFNL